MGNIGQSKDFKREYCCSIVRLKNLIPVEGSDNLLKTKIFGSQIVINKEFFKEDDIVVFANNETALCKDFLSVNNLFNLHNRALNANAELVASLMKDYEENYIPKHDEFKSQMNEIKKTIKKNTNKVNRWKVDINKIGKKKDITPEEIESAITKIQDKIDKTLDESVALTVKLSELRLSSDTLVEEYQPVIDVANKLCGFFEGSGRVRCIKLRNENSFGCIFPIDNIVKYCPTMKYFNWEEHIDEDFDMINDELFVSVYVPPVQIRACNNNGNSSSSKSNKAKMFDRIVGNEFSFHYDTHNLDTRNIVELKPDTIIDCSVKMHGTSIIIAKHHVKEKFKLSFPKNVWNWFVDTTGCFEKLRIQDYNVVYGPIFSSRKVIKNRYLNPEVGLGYYKEDIYSEWGDKIYPYLLDGMSVYGEIVGHLSNGHDIQKGYDYKCEEFESKFMPYRITTLSEDGSLKEWNISEVVEWTNNLVAQMKEKGDENVKQVLVLPHLFHGKVSDLYPDIDEYDEDYCEKLLVNFQNDKEHFGMEMYEPFCNKEVPREGICIRIEDDKFSRCFKVKTNAFKYREAILIDTGEMDIEMEDGYSQATEEE